MKARTWFVAAATVAVVVATSMMQDNLAAQGAGQIVISEYRFRGPQGANDEFVELFNAGSAPVNVSGWLIRASSPGSPAATRATVPTNTIIGPGCYYLVVNNSAAGGYLGAVPGNLTYTNQFNDDGGVAVTAANGAIADMVGQGPTGFGEGQRLTLANLGIDLTTDVERGIERRPGTIGHLDTGNNLSDFQVLDHSNPQNADASHCLAPVDLAVTGTSAPSVEQGQPLTVFATASPATVPLSAGIHVTGDFSPVGGSSLTFFADDGIAPDVHANDNVFSAQVTVPAGHPTGAHAITLTATDQQGRTATHSIAVNVTLPSLIYVPHEIQGAGDVSPLPVGELVTVRGVITGMKVDGFFLQTEPGSEDADMNTSEGLFVHADGSLVAEANVGRVVYLNGTVAELVPSWDPASPPMTAIDNVSFVFDLGPGELPAPVELTSVELSDAGTVTQLERFEGMRVHVASLTAVSGTRSDGAFYAVVTGQARPFREPGVEPGYAVLPCALDPCNVPAFDGNPERVRVDSDGLVDVTGAQVSTGAVIEDVTGPLGLESRWFTIFPEAALNPVGGMSMTAAPPANGNQYSVASLALGGPLDDDRRAKASSMVRNVLNMPDILAVQDVDSADALAALAQTIDADAAAAGQPVPQYEAQVFDGAESSTLGVLAKKAGARVSVQSVEQVGTSPLFEHPSIMMRATVTAPSAVPQTLTVLVNQLQSQAGSDLPDDASVRELRKAQAEFLANFLQARQSNDPAEAIVSLGDYNAFSFNDGYVDSIGTIVGNPAMPAQVALSSNDLVSPDLVNVSDLIAPSDRYSSISNGNAQALDHVLTTANLLPRFAGVARPRVNADFPEMLSVDPATPGFLSDRDPMVAYFTLPADAIAPVLNMPGDQTVEATGAGGAMATFTATATDNLDPSVGVTCVPASGSLFPLGNNGVTCSAKDAAGNVATASFTVTVRDTTAPVLTAPANMTLEASSAAGKVVTFAATASDLVTPSPAVTCTPGSGSTFALGTTPVACTTHDAAGNVSSAAFTITVRDTTKPVLSLPGHITADATSPSGRAVSFAASATDAVTPSPAVTCTPASGSTFAVGDTVVTCAAADAAGNVATGSFTVTINTTAASTAGRLAGAGEVGSNQHEVNFAFDVRETRNQADRGWLVVRIRESRRPDRFLVANISDARFSNASGYAPGRRPLSGVDTVEFSGVGWWNGASGYRVRINASDRGEPGRNHDTFSITVFAPNGAVVESTTGVLRDGNIQSLR